MSIEDELEMSRIVETVMRFASSPDSQRKSMSAAFRYWWLKGHETGYNEAMTDAKVGKDKRVVAHLN